MPDNLLIYYSNRVEILYEALKKALFHENPRPFSRRLVLVPSPAMQAWLMRKMAADPELGICAGVEICHLESGLAQADALRGVKAAPFPSREELALKIEAEIRQAMEKERDDSIWGPLFSYLGDCSRKKGQKRRASLSIKLAHLFSQYDRYGEKLTACPEKMGWQGRLWERVIPEEKGEREEKGAVADFELYLFAMSFISREQFNRLSAISEQKAVYCFNLSPCERFWSDLLSDKQARGLESRLKQKEVSDAKVAALEELLRERNPVLANFGKLGKEMALLFEESGAQMEERYSLPEAAARHPAWNELLHEEIAVERGGEPLSLLHALQADLLLLRVPVDPVNIPSDSSFQVHQAPTIMREMQILSDRLIELVGEKGVVPEEIVVMAPDMMEYAPYIPLALSESGIDYQIMDMEILSENPLAEGFLHLLSLVDSRWDALSVMKLFDHPPFQRKMGLKQDEVSKIHQWIRQLDVRWGQDGEHRDEVLRKDQCGSGMADERDKGTWEEGFERLIGLLVKESENSLETTQAELAGRWAAILRAIRDDLRPLATGKEMPAAKWALYLKCLFQAYFDPENEEQERPLLAVFSSLKGSDFPLPYVSVRVHLDALLENEKVTYRERNLSAVRFCSMLPMRAIPADTIILLGMQEGAFPKPDRHFSLNLMQGRSDLDYCPSQVDYDRYLFLEILLSARNRIIVSYQGVSSTDLREQPPSLLLEELFRYLDSYYTVDGQRPSESLVQKHPLHFFDGSYFSEESKVRSYSKQAYEAACAYCEPHKALEDPLLVVCETEEEREPVIQLKDLSLFARDPVRAFYNKRLGIYLETGEKRELKVEEDFALSPLSSYKLKTELMKKPLQAALSDPDLSRLLPSGLLKELSIGRLREEEEERKKFLSGHGIDRSALFQITLSTACDKPEIDGEGNRIAPAPEVGGYFIEGVLDFCSPSGLIVHKKIDKETFSRMIPEYLVFQLIAATYFPDLDPSLIALNDGKKRGPYTSDPKRALEQYLRYFQLGMTRPSPLIPDWVGYFLDSDSRKCRDRVLKKLADHQYFYNDYLKRISRSRFKPDIETLWEFWHQHAVEQFQSAKEEWVGKK